MRSLVLSLALVVLVTSCAADPGESPSSSPRPARDPPSVEPWPEPPTVPDGPLDPSVAEELDRVLATIIEGAHDADALDAVAASGDARLAWLISDMLRFVPADLRQRALLDAFTELTGVDPRSTRRFGAVPWLAVTNLLIGWDLPAPPGYRERKAGLFVRVEPKWQPFFADAESTIDWRVTSWGGVYIDDRAVGDGRPCSRPCIPALDDPALTSAPEGGWFDDERTVFGLVVGGEAVAFPKNIMEVHEMVNLTIGGRRIGLPYCTLCGSAQAYLTDAVPDGVEPPVLRTSGLLARSNKVMYDLVSGSLFDTFTGRAMSGPLREIGFELEQVSVVVGTWGEWKAAHPDTKIVAADGGIGRSYPDDPLGGRDDDGPIFPIGPADPRLPAQAPVLGVIDHAGRPIAFSAELARTELAAGARVELDGVELVADGGGLRAVDGHGVELPTHEAFWFAWSQFHPDTALWAPLHLDRSEPDGTSPPDPRAAFTRDMCPILLDLLEVDARLGLVREATERPAALRSGGQDLRELASDLGSLVRRLEGLPRWSHGEALRVELLGSLRAIRRALIALADRLAEGEDAGLVELPYIAGDAMDSAMLGARRAGLDCQRSVP